MSGNEAFLATTALEGFWDKDGNNLFLGRWCLPQDGEVLPYPLDDRELFEEAVRVCGDAYETTLAALAGALNDLHGVSHPLIYWRILLGPWLLHYVSIIHERWLCLKRALEGRNLVTRGLARESYVVRADFNEFMEGIHEDGYNLQLYTQLGTVLGLKFISREALVHPRPRTSNDPYRSAAVSLSGRLAGGAARIWLSNPRLSKKDSMRLAMSARALPLNRLVPALKMTRPPLSTSSREALGRLALGRDDFSRALQATLPDNLPWRYLEGYKESVRRLARFNAPKALVLTTADFRSEVLFLAARFKSQGVAKLITVQHGGSFGMARHSPLEAHERLVSDEYWSWGWDGDKVRPMPSFLPSKASAAASGDILYCGNTMPRYHYRLWSNPLGPQWLEVIRWRHRWLKALAPEASGRVVMRLYPGDPYGWSQAERLRGEFPGVRLDSVAKPFAQALAECSLFVCDSNHTTYLEALALDKPTILFWAERLNELRDSAVPYFRRLVQAGVLHHSPQDAARKVNEVLEDPLAWWKSPDVRSAVEDFKARFVGLADDSLGRWEKELLRLSARP